jgi:hypothetical protein
MVILMIIAGLVDFYILKSSVIQTVFFMMIVPTVNFGMNWVYNRKAKK